MLPDTIISLSQTVSDFKNWAGNVPEGWDAKPSPGKWSPKELIGHLIDSAQVNLQRFVRCTYESSFKLVYFQNEWVAAAHYQDAEVQELLQLWMLLNRQIIRVWQYYPEDRLNAVCDNSKDGVELHSVTFLATDYVAHMQHHLAQIKNLLG